MTENDTLIAYVSKGGATEEAANTIAKILREKYGLKTDLVDLRRNQQPDIHKYGNIVIGAGVRAGAVYSDALKFLENDFSGKKTALFLSSMDAGDAKTYDAAIEKYIKPILKEHPRMKPVAFEAFGGRVRFFGITFADNRDAGKINAWAEMLGKKLRNA